MDLYLKPRLTAHHIFDPGLELPFLPRLQSVRYVEGRDLADHLVVDDVASEFGGNATDIAECVLGEINRSRSRKKIIPRGKALMPESEVRRFRRLSLS